MPVSEVWGCGKQTAQKLSQLGIITAYDLAQLNQLEMRDRYGVVLTRTIKELNGEEALEWAPDHSQSKQIIASRSLGEKTDNPEILFAAIRHMSLGPAKSLGHKMRSLTLSQFTFIPVNFLTIKKLIYQRP